jgi:collagen type III alpha
MSTVAGLTKRQQPSAGRPRDERLLRELQRTAERIRWTEITTAVFILAVACAVYVLVVALADQALRPEGLPGWLRKVLFAGFLAGCGIFAWFRLIVPLGRKVSLLYAAWRLEKSAQVTRHALTAYLDLRERPIPNLVKEALRREAQEDFRYTDPEAAAQPGQCLRWFFVLVTLLIVMGVFALFVPEQFLSLVARALVPFTDTAIPPDTRFELLAPEKDGPYVEPHKQEVLEIPVRRGQPVTVRVKVHGLVPPEAWLETWTQPGEQPTRRTMTAIDQYRTEWQLELGASSVPASGLFFRVVGGDGQSRVYRLVERLTNPPELRQFEITIHYPEYTRREAKTQTVGEIEALVGSQVEIAVFADQPIVSGELTVESGQPPRQEVFQLVQKPDSDPNHQPNRVFLPDRLTLKQGWQRYSVVLKNKSNQYSTLQWFNIRVIEDQRPVITLDQVGQEKLPPANANESGRPVVKLPADATVAVIGTANDDFAADRVWLVLQEVEGQKRLLRIAHEAAEIGPLQKPNGFTPIVPAAYQLTLDLTRAVVVSDSQKSPGPAEPVRLAAGTKLLLWVEGTDCKRPEPNTGKSREVLLELTEPQRPPSEPEKPNPGKPDKPSAQERGANEQKPSPDNKPETADKPASKPEDNAAKPSGSGEEKPSPDKSGSGNPEQRGSGQNSRSPDKSEPGTASGSQSSDKPQKPEPGSQAGGSAAGKPEDKPQTTNQGGGSDVNAQQKPAQNQPGQPNAGQQENSPQGNNTPQAGDPQKPGGGGDGGNSAQAGQSGSGQKPSGSSGASQSGSSGQAGNQQQPGQGQSGQPGQAGSNQNGGNQQASGQQKPGQGQAGEASAGQKPGESPQNGNQGGGNQQAGGQQAGSGQSGQANAGEQSGGKPDSGQGSEPGQGGASNSGNASSQQPPDKPGSQAGPTSGGNTSGVDRQGPAQDSPLATKPMKPNPEFSEAPGDLTLDSLRKKMERGEIDKPTLELMQRLGVKTPEELQRLLRDKPQVVQAELSQGRRRAIGPNRAATREGQSADVDASDRPVLPPELRDAYEEFTRRFRP